VIIARITAATASNQSPTMRDWVMERI